MCITSPQGDMNTKEKSSWSLIAISLSRRWLLRLVHVFQTIFLDSVPIHVLADQYTTFLTLFNSSWLNFSFFMSLGKSSYLNRSHKKFLSILHGWFFSLSVILWFRADKTNWPFLYFSLFSIFFCKRKSMPEFFTFDAEGRSSLSWVSCAFRTDPLDFFVDRLQFLRRFEWRHTLYAQTNKYDNNRWADNFKRQKSGPKGQQCTSFLHHQRFDSF